MLRVYSVLYIERLWNNNSIVSQNKDLIHSSNSSTHSQIIVTDAYTSREIQVDDAIIHEDEDEHEDEYEHEDDDDEEEEEEEEDYQESPEENAQTQVQEPFVKTEKNNIPEEIKVLDIRIAPLLVETLPQQQNEHIINSLTIDTNNLQDFSAHAKAQAEAMSITEQESPVAAVAEKSADHLTSISSLSSILPPLTPSSVYSAGIINDASEKPKSTSLIRRETQKINDRRKSLTKKIKRVLTVKSENKRKSV